MESVLHEVNAVLGVVGSFVCLPDGRVAAQVMPEQYSSNDLNLAARVTSQTFHALDLSRQRVAEAVLLYDAGRLVLKNFHSGILVIVCARNINLPLLNLTANVAVKKLATATRVSKTAAAKPAAPPPITPPLPSPVATPALPESSVPVTPPLPVTPGEVELPNLVGELQKQAHQIVETAASAQIPLWLMDPVALWERCPGRRRLLTIPRQRHLELAGHAEHLSPIIQFFGRLGYRSNTRPNAPPTTHRLYFTGPETQDTLVIFLDTFEMYHRFDLKPFLKPNASMVPVTALALVRLQLVEMPDEALSDLAALLIEYDVSLTPKDDQIDAAQITALCVDDWGWYKTVSMNLEQLIYFAEDNMFLAERSLVVERARRLKSSLDATPKSLRWQARARLGESVRWYEIPVEASAPSRPDMAIG